MKIDVLYLPKIGFRWQTSLAKMQEKNLERRHKVQFFRLLERYVTCNIIDKKDLWQQLMRGMQAPEELWNCI